MRKPSVRNYLKKMQKFDVYGLNYGRLMSFITENKIPIKMRDFPYSFSGALGATYPNGIILNYKYFASVHPRDQYHIILHEIGHYLRIQKVGFENINAEIRKLTQYSEFFNHLFIEEKFAEKFATITYYAWHKEIDKSTMKLDFNSEKFKRGIESYAHFLHDELIKSDMTFFEYMGKQLKF